MNYVVYVIKNKDGKLYIGQTNNLERRLFEHNSKRVFSTKSYCPWVLVYLERVGNRDDARKKGKYLKSGNGKEYLKSLLKQKSFNFPG